MRLSVNIALMGELMKESLKERDCYEDLDVGENIMLNGL
jgi:hypothetical protein